MTKTSKKIEKDRKETKKAKTSKKRRKHQKKDLKHRKTTIVASRLTDTEKESTAKSLRDNRTLFYIVLIKSNLKGGQM